MEEISEEVRSDLEKWEKKLHSINEKSLEQFKSDFIDRPDQFISNLLILSVQFYENYEK